MKKLANKALILVGFQNDYFDADGILHAVIEESSQVTGVLQNTLNMLRDFGEEFSLVVNTPIHFTSDYSELTDPIGILKVIADVGAFKQGSKGAKVIPQLDEFSSFIHHVPGRRGLNVFTKTNLESILREAGVTDVVFAGTVTSLCIDSSARSAVDLGFSVTVLSDCTSSRTTFEQDFYCNDIFPLYASVTTSTNLISNLTR